MTTSASLAVVCTAALWVLANYPLASLGPPPPPPPPRRHPTIDPGTIALELAEHLHSGAPIARAWQHVAHTRGLDPSTVDGIPTPNQLAPLGAIGEGISLGLALAARTGAPLAPILHACANSAAANADAAAARAIALAGPRSSARILAGLPLLGLLAAGLIGIDVLTLLTGGGVASLSALIGMLAWGSGWWWSRRLLRAASHSPPLTEPLMLDLAAAALQAGAGIPVVLTQLGEIANKPAYRTAARGLVLGLPWSQAWHSAPNDPLCEALAPAWQAGLCPVRLLTRRAERMRAGAMRTAHEAAGALHARLVLPLGVCYLPAFICIALIPTLIALSAQWLN